MNKSIEMKKTRIVARDDFIDFYRYRCCCRSSHVRHGAVIIGVCELLIMAYQLVNSVIALTKSDLDAHVVSISITFVALFIGVIVVGCLFFGLVKKKPVLLVPHLLMQVRIYIAWH